METYLIGKSLAVRRGASELSGGYNKALVSPQSQVPASAPVVTLGRLWSSVYDEGERISLVGVEIGGVEDESLNVVAVIVGDPEVGHGV
jgi:hypothetical protein